MAVYGVTVRRFPRMHRALSSAVSRREVSTLDSTGWHADSASSLARVCDRYMSRCTSAKLHEIIYVLVCIYGTKSGGGGLLLCMLVCTGARRRA